MLIGVSAYAAMPPDRQLPAVANNLKRLAELLADERVWGLPPENCAVVEPDHAEDVMAAVRAAAKAATGTLLVYYAGHGLTDPLKDGGALYLALPGSYEPGGTHTALNYGDIKATLLREGANVPQKVVVLDCCWSALAIPGAMGGAGGEAFANAAAIKGTAVLTACAATQQARSPEGETYTAFTGALIELLDQGVPGGPDTLDVGTLYTQLRTRLGPRGMPEPQLGCVDDGSRIALARNTAPRPPEEHTKPPDHPAAATSARPDGAELRRRSRELLRVGDYEGATRLLRHAAAAGDREAVAELAVELRRSSHYDHAAALEQATLHALPRIIAHLHTSGIL